MLTRTATHVAFRLFGEQYTYTWKQFSILLGIDKNCNHNLDRAVEGFDRVDFWKEISAQIARLNLGLVKFIIQLCALCTDGLL